MNLVKLIIFCLFLVSCKSESADFSLKVMTYNIRLDTASDGENAWTNRKDVLSAQILFLSPDVLGVQEALPNQIQDLNSALQDYSFIGEARNGNEEGEYSAIYYNSKKIKVEEQHTFWLSETPNEVSKGWDAAYLRICTYGLFKSIEGNNKFWVFNTHLDHVGIEARKKSVQLIVQKMNELNTKKLPVILMGDLNMEPNHESIQFINQHLSDSKTIANINFGPTGTFNGFHFNKPVKRRIDYIFTSKNINVKKYAVLSDNWDNKYPSDHLPVYVEIKF